RPGVRHSLLDARRQGRASRGLPFLERSARISWIRGVEQTAIGLPYVVGEVVVLVDDARSTCPGSMSRGRHGRSRIGLMSTVRRRPIGPWLTGTYVRTKSLEEEDGMGLKLDVADGLSSVPTPPPEDQIGE